METPQRILIVRLTAIGDTIHGIPVLNALRAKYPHAYIGWVVEGRSGDLLEGHPALDALIRVPRKWLKQPKAILKLRRQLKAAQFDTTLDLQALSKSSFAAWLSGAKHRIGFAGKKGREISKCLNNDLITVTNTHVIDCYLDLLRAVEIHQPAVEYLLPETEQDAATVKKMLQELGLSEEHYILINPGAGWDSRLWVTARYGEVAAGVAQQFALKSLVVWAGENELAMAKEIVANSSGNAVLAPATSMTELAALIRRGSLFVGSDTGPLHLAVAVGTPAVSLHGTTRAEVSGAHGPTNRTVQARYHAGTSTERRNTDNSAMREITVPMVLASLGELLASR